MPLTVFVLAVCAPSVFAALVIMLADIAPATYGRIEQTVRKIPGVQWTWDRLYSGLSKALGTGRSTR